MTFWHALAWSRPCVGRLARLAAGIAALCLGTALPAAAQAVDNRPNVILLLADDMRSDDLPQLARLQSLLVAQGTEFQAFFAPNALCCPARTSILRGQFSHNHGVWTNFQGRSGGFPTAYRLGLESETIAVWLQRAGYDTALMGKYLNGYAVSDARVPGRRYVPPGWTDWFGIVDPPGDGMYAGYNYEINENGTIRGFGASADDYSTDVLARRARDFVSRPAGVPRKPFFLYLAPTAPHRPIGPAPRHIPNPYAGYTPSFGANFNEADVSDKPAWIQILKRLSGPQTQTMIADSRERLGSMLAVEDMVEDLLTTLSVTGELENTYVFFVSDNGLHQGEHRLRSKATVYDEAVRVPMVLRGPGVPAGEALPHMVYNHDLAPTIAALAGIATPGFVDGVSLLPLLDPATRPLPSDWRRSVLLEHREHNDKGSSQPDNFSIRTNNYQYVEYADPAQRCELYHIAADADPARLRNRCGEPELAQVQSRLATRLRELRTCAGSACRDIERRSVP